MMGKQWRQFKNYLTRNYILDEKSKHFGKDPCKVYQGLAEAIWAKFKEERENEAFLEKRKKQQQIRAKNLHDHRLGSGGYAREKERYIKRVIKQREEAGEPIDAAIPDRDRYQVLTIHLYMFDLHVYNLYQYKEKPLCSC